MSIKLGRPTRLFKASYIQYKYKNDIYEYPLNPKGDLHRNNKEIIKTTYYEEPGFFNIDINDQNFMIDNNTENIFDDFLPHCYDDNNCE